MSTSWATLKDALGLTLRPVDLWPGKLRASYDREASPYTAPLKDTLRVLKYELQELGATSIVLQIAIRERDIRLDGLPRADARAEHPGVILSFETKAGPRRRAFDRFMKWEHNLRALASNLQHLRHANLYGVEEDAVQYAGWKALPAPQTLPAEIGAARDLLDLAGEYGPSSQLYQGLIDDPEARRDAWKRAVKRHHPDAGGDPEKFHRAQAAYDLLEKSALKGT
jgi:hypothetical protein